MIGQTFSGNNVETNAHFDLYHILNDGSVKGKKYEIRAVAWREFDWNLSTDTEYYYLTLSQPRVDSGIKENTNVYGHAEVTRHYFNGTSFVMDAYANAFN